MKLFYHFKVSNNIKQRPQKLPYCCTKTQKDHHCPELEVYAIEIRERMCLDLVKGKISNK